MSKKNKGDDGDNDNVVDVDFKKTTKDLAQRFKDGDVDAGKALEEIVINYGQWRSAKSECVRVGKETKEKVTMQEAEMGTAIEASLPAAPNKGQVLGKLESVERSWSDLQEAKAERVEEKRRTSENLKTWDKKLNEAITHSAQLTLPQVG